MFLKINVGIYEFVIAKIFYLDKLCSNIKSIIAIKIIF